jgi:MFS family permease
VQIFRSLEHRNFRLYFFGQTISVIGFWLQSIAIGWLVYRLTDSGWMLGLVAFCTHIPMLLVSPFAGLLADRVDRRKLVIASQSLQMVQALVLAVLAFGQWITPEHIVVLALVQGIAQAFDAPARHALLPAMIGGTAGLPNAIALNSLVMNLGRFIGPAIAGVLIAWLGEAGCFLLNAISYLAVLFALLQLPAVPPRARAPSSLRAEMLEGFAWVSQCLPARVLMINLAVLSLTAPTYQTLMPMFVQEVFGGDSKTLGILVGAAGLGALAGTLLLASRQSMRGLTTLINVASLLAGLGLLAFSLTRSVGFAMVALVLVGFGIIVTAAGTNTVLQRVVEDRLRARVISIYLMSFIGTAPLGSLVLGALAGPLGPALATGGFALVCVASAVWLWWVREPLSRALEVEYRRAGEGV